MSIFTFQDRWRLTPLFAVLAIGAAFPAYSEDGAEAIVAKHETAKIADLRAYIEANPEADDLWLAWAELSESLTVIGDDEGLIAVLEQRHALADKVSGDRVVVGAWLQEVVGPLMELYAGGGDREQAAAYLDRVLEETKESPMAEDLAQYVQFMRDQLNQPMVGDELAMAFTALDGREVDLAEMKGKVVLVDFWATWCQPCLVEIPHILAAYQKFNEKGFEVIGVSLDQSEDALTTYIEREGLPWPQHFTGAENEFAEKFGISAIPATFLIGPDGKIVASDLRGEDLEAWLEKLLVDAEE